MHMAKGLDVIFERPLVFEVRATKAIPNLATVLFMSPPITFHSKGLPTFSTQVGFDAMLPLVVSLEGPEVFERLGSWMLYVVFAPFCTTIAWQP